MTTQPIDDGGPAFSRPASVRQVRDYPESSRREQNGMSLRDYFAGHACAGLSQIHCGYEVQGIAQRAYAIADAMIAARKAKP
jgi:hypothetical protein